MPPPATDDLYVGVARWLNPYEGEGEGEGEGERRLVCVAAGRLTLEGCAPPSTACSGRRPLQRLVRQAGSSFELLDSDDAECPLASLRLKADDELLLEVAADAEARARSSRRAKRRATAS